MAYKTKSKKIKYPKGVKTRREKLAYVVAYGGEDLSKKPKEVGLRKTAIRVLGVDNKFHNLYTNSRREVFYYDKDGNKVYAMKIKFKK